jgi:hypothetical protein
MKPIEQIKKELTAFGNKYDACERGTKAIKGDNLKELFQNINKYIFWCKETPEKVKEFNAIFDNELVIEDGFLLSNCTNLTSIIIPNSVTSIGEEAFRFCTGLTSIIIPESVISIGKGAFYKCTGLTSITIPDSVTSIREGVFEGCSGLISIIIPESVTSIGDYAFYSCREDLQIIRK